MSSLYMSGQNKNGVEIMSTISMLEYVKDNYGTMTKFAKAFGKNRSQMYRYRDDNAVIDLTTGEIVVVTMMLDGSKVTRRIKPGPGFNV